MFESYRVSWLLCTVAECAVALGSIENSSVVAVSLQPNQPGVRHSEVEIVLDVDIVLVVLSSKHFMVNVP